MFLFWGRYLPRHERTGSTFHVALLAISVTAALCLYRLAVATLRGAERKPFNWKGTLASRRGYQTVAFAAAVGALFGVVSWGARWGIPSYIPRGRVASSEPLTWVPRLMGLVGYSPFANLENAEISQKKTTWSKNDKNLDAVVGAQLKGMNLRYAEAEGAFLAGSNLLDADLSGAELRRADLSGTDLSAHLRGTNLTDADLRGADLRGADLGDAYLSDADLRGVELREADLSCADLRNANMDGARLSDSTRVAYTNFEGAKNLDLHEVNHWAIDWNKAFYDDKTLKALGLPPDHNDKLQKEYEELQRKRKPRLTEPEGIPRFVPLGSPPIPR